MATKFAAFKNRGSDYRISHDFEDIMYVLDNRITIVPEIEKAHPLIKEFLKSEFIKIMNDPYLDEILSSHIHPLMFEERYPVVLEKLHQITS